MAMLLSLAAMAVVAAGCGGGEETTSSPGSEAAASGEEATTKEPAAIEVGHAMKSGSVVKVVSSEYGRVLADAEGEALYLFDKETAPRSACYGTCAKAWPPVLTEGRPQAGAGASQDLLGTTRRRDGRRQVTYAGHPLYYYVGDSPGTILCHDVEEFGGLWLVVEPGGRAAS